MLSSPNFKVISHRAEAKPASWLTQELFNFEEDKVGEVRVVLVHLQDIAQELRLVLLA